MKNIFAIIFLFSVVNFAQNFDGIRIYINPGHGGHDSDDRYIAATGFWESEGNLSKGLFLRDILNSFGAATKMSRTTNNTSDDLGLSVISADANNFNADYFQSIHSNATGIDTKRNTTLILFRGYDNQPVFPESKEMANYLVDEIYKAHRTLGKSVRGDWDFYPWGTQGLGVLRGLNMPGTLSEGSFHDYIPESYRLRNQAYLKHEAWAFTKAFIKYFGLETLPYGEIAGIVRDPFSQVTYVSITNADNNKPLNLVKATLLPENKLYLGDALNNGFYLFDKVEPGVYQIVLEAEGTSKDTVSVTVTAGNTTFADKYLIQTNQRQKLSLLKNYPANNGTNISSTVKIKIQFDGPLDFNSLGGNVSFRDANGFDVPLKTFDETNYENGWIIFEPNQPLINDATYTINVLKGIYDIYKLRPSSDLIINFQVEPNNSVTGTQLESFEELTDWWQPEQSGSTTGIDPDNTSFVISGKKSIDGNSSGLLYYLFNSPGEGICRVYKDEQQSLIPVSTNFGMWVFGDFSNNYLEYWFRNSEGTNIPLFVDSLNWTGWRFKSLDLTQYTGLNFHSLVIKQNARGENSGQVYFDLAQENNSITGVENNSIPVSSNFTLNQNYPNPFNPTTTISYSIPQPSVIAIRQLTEKQSSEITSVNSFPSNDNINVSIKIYDVLGRLVRVLFNDYQKPGNYNIEFDGSNLTSGIYYYVVTADNFTATKKMILLK